MRIWKYEVRKRVRMQNGGKILRLEQVGQKVYVWVMVNAGTGFEDREFLVVETGEEFDAEGKDYVGTCITDGWHVKHVFVNKGE